MTIPAQQRAGDMEHTRTITRTFETGAKAVLHVEARSGAVIVDAHAGADVMVEAVVHVWSDIPAEADEAAALVERGMEQDAHRVIVRTPSLPQTEGWSLWGGKRGSRVDFRVRVPAQTAVRVLSRSGRVQVTGTHGRLHVESASGRVGIADVNGNVTVISRSGSLALERITGDVEAEVRSGRLDARAISGSVKLESRSGATDVRDVTGDLAVRAHTGSLTIENVHGCIYARAHTGMIRYRGAIEGDVDMKAQTGTIHLSVDPEKPFFLDAESQIGSVRSDLPPRRGGAGEPGEGGAKVKLRSHTGSIRLSRM
jgi:hypothetical protein